jgi:hypothetical protein
LSGKVTKVTVFHGQNIIKKRSFILDRLLQPFLESGKPEEIRENPRAANWDGLGVWKPPSAPASIAPRDWFGLRLIIGPVFCPASVEPSRRLTVPLQ